MNGKTPYRTTSTFTQGRLMAALGSLLLLVPASVMAAGSITTDSANGLTDKTKEVLEISQAAVGRQVGDYVFSDGSGREFRIGDFRGKPLVISMVYTSCTDTCPPIITSLAGAVDISRDGMGEGSFNILTIGFDSAFDTPEQMQIYSEALGVGDDRWHFVSGEIDQVQGLADDLGFVYYPAKGGFDHLDQVTVIDGKGVVHTQIYGANITPTLLGEPLKAIMFGTSTPYASVEDLVKRVRLFCTVYDPELGRYRFDYAIFVHLLAGATFLLVVGTFLVRQLIRFAAEARAQARAQSRNESGNPV